MTAGHLPTSPRLHFRLGEAFTLCQQGHHLSQSGFSPNHVKWVISMIHCILGHVNHNSWSSKYGMKIMIILKMILCTVPFLWCLPDWPQRFANRGRFSPPLTKHPSYGAAGGAKSSVGTQFLSRSQDLKNFFKSFTKWSPELVSCFVMFIRLPSLQKLWPKPSPRSDSWNSLAPCKICRSSVALSGPGNLTLKKGGLQQLGATVEVRIMTSRLVL